MTTSIYNHEKFCCFFISSSECEWIFLKFSRSAFQEHFCWIRRYECSYSVISLYYSRPSFFYSYQHINLTSFFFFLFFQLFPFHLFLSLIHIFDLTTEQIGWSVICILGTIKGRLLLLSVAKLLVFSIFSSFLLTVIISEHLGFMPSNSLYFLFFLRLLLLLFRALSVSSASSESFESTNSSDFYPTCFQLFTTASREFLPTFLIPIWLFLLYSDWSHLEILYSLSFKGFISFFPFSFSNMLSLKQKGPDVSTCPDSFPTEVWIIQTITLDRWRGKRR